MEKQDIHNILRALIVFLGLGVVVMGVWRLSGDFKRTRPSVKTLPFSDYGMVDSFSLTERSGEELSSQDLKGKIWVADFIFTRCAGPCPRLTQKMAQLQEEYLNNAILRLVSFTVDPKFDTPQVLAEYADRYGANKSQWFFLTGKTEKVYELILKSFRLAVQENTDPARKLGEEVNHSLKFVLVDQEGRIRGYYTGTDPKDLGQLRRDIQGLL